MSVCIVYVACADDNEIDMWRLDSESEAMARVGRVPVPGGPAPSPSLPLAFGPDRRHLYAGLRVAPFPVVTFAVDPSNGTLTLAGTGTLADSMAYIATDRTGQLLLSASYGGAVVGVNRIGADGVADGKHVQCIRTPPAAHCIVVSPDNRFAYATSLGGDAILCWPVDRDGLREDAETSFLLAPGAGPRHLAFGGPGTLYAINELDGTLDVLGRDAGTGALAHRQTVETTPQAGAGKAAAADLHLTPDGRLLYASIRSTNRIAAFRVAADGSVTALGQHPVEDTPRAFAISPDGRFLVSAGRNNAMLGVYVIDSATGALTPVGRYATGGNPNWVEMLPLPG